MRAAMKARAGKDFIVTVPGYSVPLMSWFMLCGVFIECVRIYSGIGGSGHALIWNIKGIELYTF